MPPHSSSSHHPLRIVPKELVFPAPLNRVITNILKLQNVTQSPIAYKVKTTAPQRYCVRPNNGILPPGETIEVQVLLNYVKDAPPNLDVKDKFQIQSIILPAMPANPADIGEVWAKATNEQITKQKLKSRFTAPTSSSQTNKPAVPPTNPTIPTQDVTNDGNVPPTTTTTTPTGNIIDNTPILQSTSQEDIHPPQTKAQPHSPSIFQPSIPPQHSVEKKLLVDSSDLYSTPVISSIITETKDVPVGPSSSLSGSQNTIVTHDIPKSTGDFVDTVANFTKLRQSLEQVALLKSEKESVLKDNQKLNDQIKMLVDQLQRAKEENQGGLRQRTSHSTPGPALVSTRPDSHSQQMLIQIQTKVLLIVVLFFAVIGFLLGRYSR